MRILGLIGGMGWASTLAAYRHLNLAVDRARGGGHGAELLIRSVDFARIHAMQQADDWAGAGDELARAARQLEGAGAGALLLCTNTMHRVADAISEAVDIPLLHIADATAAAVRGAGVGRVGLLGTRFTMEGAFYADRLAAHGLDVVVPGPSDRQVVHDIIYDELVREVITPASRVAVQGVVARLLEEERVGGVIAGCTEIELLVDGDDVDVPWFPTTQIHTEAGAAWLLDGLVPPAPPAP